MFASMLRTTIASNRAQWLIFAAIAIILASATLLAAGHYGSDQADQAVTQRGQVAAQLQVSALVAELDKQRAVRFVIARDAEVIATLQSPQTDSLARLDAKLETLNDGARSNVIYIIDLSGIAIASSNYRSATSFVGNDYRFRTYFQDAMANGTAQLFALGTVSRRPGLYIAERIDGPTGPLGVAVVKLEFDALEAMWQADGAATYVMDERGIVLLSSIKDWQFFSREALEPDQVASLRQSLQYDRAPLEPLPVSAPAPGSNLVTAAIPPASRSDTLASISLAIPTMPWTLNALLPLRAERAASTSAARAFGLLTLMPLLAAAAILLSLMQRNQRSRQRLVTQRQELEVAVSRAMGERADAEMRADRLRDDLAQSNRLAVLGQIAAGVAHEISQPLGAIRAYAENGQTFLDRQEPAKVSDNLASITRLTERIGAITEHLRGFARKGQTGPETVDLDATINAALTLLNSNIKCQAVVVNYHPSPNPLRVQADEMGLEQIIVNLVQNALEALADRPDPQIEISTNRAQDTVTLTIADNGPGIAPEIMEQLFIPFSTSKPKGLGLGLVISHDLATSFGGSLLANPTVDTGASFTLTLRSAP